MKYYIQLVGNYYVIGEDEEKWAGEDGIEISEAEYRYEEGLEGVRRYNRQRYIYAKKRGIPCGRADKGVLDWEDIDMVEEK